MKVHLMVQREFKPGDLPPDDSAGYLAWHEWADAQRKAGIRQKPCASCGGWKTPQEMSGRAQEFSAFDSFGRKVIYGGNVCSDCSRRLPEPSA